jgi:signal transduction histidine kinase
MGLGLDVSYRVVISRHHGDLQVESEPGNRVFRCGYRCAHRTHRAEGHSRMPFSLGVRRHRLRSLSRARVLSG